MRVSPAESVTAQDELVLSLPLHRSFGLVFDGRNEGYARTHLVATAQLVAFGALHAGVLYSAMEATCMLALLPFLDEQKHAVTHDIHVSLLRPVAVDARCDIKATLLKLGRSVAFLEARASVRGAEVAVAQVAKSVIAHNLAADDATEVR